MALPEAEAYHAVRVLRLRPGEPVMLLDGRGGRAAATAAEVGSDRRHEHVVCAITAVEKWSPPRCRLHLLMAPPRARFMDQIVHQATELGVWRVTPILCEFSVARPEADALAHWQDAALAALKQSGNAFLPQLLPPKSMSAALAETASPGYFGEVPDIAAVTVEPNFAEPTTECSVWIGPEGGFSAAERTALLARGFTPLAVGNWILKVETAVPAVLGFLLGKGGHDFRSYQCP